MLIWTAFLIGFLGSFHCAGMCGPIAMSLPHQKNAFWSSFVNGLIYNGSRILTYSFLGLLIGFIGQGFFMAGAQRWISIGIGVFLLIIALFSINVEAKIVQVPWVAKFNQSISRNLGQLLGNDSTLGMVKIGVLNGLLPCGLVYMAIAGALSQSSFLGGMQYMLFFGMGTLPLMLGLSISGRLIPFSIKKRIKKAYPVFLVLFALLFILRGINFDVPLEMYLWQTTENMEYCK